MARWAFKLSALVAFAAWMWIGCAPAAAQTPAPADGATDGVEEAGAAASAGGCDNRAVGASGDAFRPTMAQLESPLRCAEVRVVLAFGVGWRRSEALGNPAGCREIRAPCLEFNVAFHACSVIAQ